MLGLSYVDQPQIQSGEVEPRQVPAIGCVVRLHRAPESPGQPGHFLAQGIRRFRIARLLSDRSVYTSDAADHTSRGALDGARLPLPHTLDSVYVLSV